MSEEWRQKVESLFHEALERSEDQREEFLEAACSGDESLLSEIKSLLLHFPRHQQFFEQRALPHIVPQSPAPTLKPGDVIGHYQVVRLLGHGGMGEVYLAKDQLLPREVAVKILARNLARSPELMERFRREADTASALNHPNIVTIHAFGQEGEIRYMVSEFVEGVQLRDCIGRLSIDEALNYARQIGQALQAAHGIGIVHRDIKPENVMVRSDGYVKVLDFGLAKLAQAQPGTGPDLLRRFAGGEIQSAPGALIGTINYMSPEQVRGQAIDQRTDIWSWGITLYEMLCARRPFQGTTPGDVLAAILNKTPDPPTHHQNLNQLVAKALAKEPEERYQTMTMALDALREVRLPDQGSGFASLRPRRFQWFSQGRGKRWAAASILLVLLSLAGIEAYRFRPAADNTFHPTKIKQLTTGGNITYAAYSPDGNYVAYVTRESQGQALRLLQVGTNTDTEKVPSGGAEYLGVTFSKDNQFVYYVQMQEHQLGALYRMPLLGGSQKLVAEDIDSPITFSPDGRRFAFVRTDPATHQDSLIARTLDQGAEAGLLTLQPPEYFMAPPAAPAWSPDGRFVLAGIYTDAASTASSIKIAVVAVDDGQKRYLGPLPWQWMGKAIWMKNGAGIAVAAQAPDSNRAQLLEVSWPEGKITAITNDLASYADLDSTADFRSLVATMSQRSSNLWSVPLASPDKSRRITQRAGRFAGVAWTASGKLISQTDIGGRPDLWAIDPVTGDHQQLTDDAYVELDPAASPDGRYLVYSSDRNGIFQLWRSSPDGGNPVRVTANSAMEMEPSITPDGREVVFTSTQAGFPTLWKAPLAGGPAVQLTRAHVKKPTVSPDGKQIACQYTADSSGDWSTAILRITGELVRLFANIPAETPVRWSADGKALLYVATKDGVSNVWLQPVDGGVPRQLTHFSEEQIFAFALSPDGKVLACIRGTRTSDIVLMAAK
jgi:YD repeat-containing protein